MTSQSGKVTADERCERLDGPIHTWFSLSYSNYLVLHRSMMQSMPAEWQRRAVELVDELDGAFPDLDRAPAYIVTPAREREYGDLSASEMKLLGVTSAMDDPANEGDHDGVFYDRDGEEHRSDDTTLVPLDADPVPHYNRGRTFIEPTP